MSYDPSELSDASSPLVVEALKVRCEVCKAKPGEDCHNLCNEGPLPSRLVHYARVAA